MAAPYTQTNRALRISTPLGQDVLLLERIQGEERISAPYRFLADLLSEKQDINPADLLGQSVTFEIDFADETRHINGIVSRVFQGDRGMRLTRYRIEVVPSLWTTTLVRNSRIFQQMAVPDILSKLLDEQTVKHSRALSVSYEPRNYCSQYRETNFAFLSRLMEQEGIFYFFKHEAGSHTLQLADVSGQVPNIPASHTKLSVMQGGTAPQLVPEPVVFRLVGEDSVISGNYLVWDHNFELPGKHLDAARKVEKGDAKYELFDYPGGYAHRFDGISDSGGEQASQLQKIFDDNIRVATLRAREAGVPYRMLRGSSNYPHLVVGHRFTVERHYRSDLNGEYVITSVQHAASVENYENSQGAPFTYSNSFTCIPASVPYAPPRITPRARVEGMQTATVVGPSGSEIFTDKYGRVKVQFNWDRVGQNDAGSSCWLRVATPWAGKNWGMIHIPRVGSEVVVDFLEGDPDRPIIVGMVYNAESMPPYTLPDNMTQSGIKSRSTVKGAAANFNEIRFEDKKDEEEVYVHAEKNLNAVVENDETRKIGFEKKDKGDQTVEVFNNQTVKVGEGKGDAADGSQTVAVYKDQTVTLETGNQTITVKQGNRSVTLDQGSESIAIKTGNRTVAIDTGNDSLTLKTGNLTTVLKMGNASLELDMGNATTKAKLGAIKEEAMQGIEMKVGQNSIKIDQMGVSIKGMMVKVEGQVQTQVKGLMTQVSGDAMMTVKGGVTMIN